MKYLLNTHLIVYKKINILSKHSFWIKI